MAKNHIVALLGVFVLLSLFHVNQLVVVEPQASNHSHIIGPADGISEYRKLLSTISPLDRAPHSKTLGVASRIYVIGLPAREDRRKSLESLERAMGKPCGLIVMAAECYLLLVRHNIHIP